MGLGVAIDGEWYFRGLGKILGILNSLFIIMCGRLFVCCF